MFGRHLRWLRARVVGLVIWLLLGAGAYFTIEVERMRSELRHSGGADFVTGERVVAVKALDGDEFIVVDTKGEKATVRLLGIKTFAAGRFGVSQGRFGKQAFEFLKRLKDQPMVLTLNTPTHDNRGRVLAYVQMADNEGFDLGERMIERGLAVAYTRYGHAREADYTRAEERAVASSTGLWADPKVVSQMEDLKRQWFLERSKEE